MFSGDNLARFDVVVFLNTTDDVLDDAQMTNLRSHLGAGRGFVGIHSATDTEYGDEWYDFREPVASHVTPLLGTATTIYPEGKPPGGDHPIAWFHEFEGGRVFYTGLGHTPESYSEPEFVTHVRAALRWAIGR